MSSTPQPKPDGAQQKRLLVNIVSDTIAALAGGETDASELPLHKASVAAAVYHYSVGILKSQEIAGRVKIDPAFAPWRKNGSPSAEDIARVRDEQPDILRRGLVEALGWSWNVPLRSVVTGMATQAYAEKVVAGRHQQFSSQAEVEAESDKRIAAAAAADLDPAG
jgi:hypothetical protein